MKNIEVTKMAIHDYNNGTSTIGNMNQRTLAVIKERCVSTGTFPKYKARYMGAVEALCMSES